MLPQQSGVQRMQTLLSKVIKLYVIVLVVVLGMYMSIIDPDRRPRQLIALNQQTQDTLKALVRTKFFRIIRINIENECPFWARERMCKSGSCTVCRCDEKDIPQEWTRTDPIEKETPSDLEQWSAERTDNSSGIWHVEDIENDRGEYFDVDLNKEAYTAYNGSNIWQLVYHENCFGGNFQNMCREEKVLYRIISGLHTSISTHLSYFFKDIPVVGGMLAVRAPAETDNESVYYLNEKLYRQKVAKWPERVNNLYFLYSMLLGSVTRIKQELHDYPIVSENIQEDLSAKIYLNKLLAQLDSFKPPKETEEFLKVAGPYVQQYQRYVHNISRIMDCVECEKCRLFGKMQTYGLGTAMKILFGYADLKRNELVALMNTLNKVSMSVSINRQLVKSLKQNLFVYLMVFAWGGCCLLLFLYAALKIYRGLDGRVHNMFHHVFPKEE